MIKSILNRYLIKLILAALIALVLYGVFPSSGLAIILTLFAASRLTSLAVEVWRKVVSAREWKRSMDDLTDSSELFTSEQGAAKARALRTFAGEPTKAQLIGGVPPRTDSELVAEALGVIAFVILAPLDIALYNRDFFSLRISQGWEGAAVAFLCAALYAWPRLWLKSPGHSRLRIVWWALPFVVALLLLNHAIETRHPYLNPFEPDRDRLAAERVLALKNIVVAGQHADWVLRYARELDERGESLKAIFFYREALRLDANNREAYARLGALEARSSSNPVGNEAKLAVLSSAPYWTADKPVTKSPRRRIDSGLESVEGCTVVVVAVGEVSDELLDAVGYVVHSELGLPAFISTDLVLPPARTRVRGLLTGPQWDQSSLVRAFTNSIKHFPAAPVKYVLVTPMDIYMESANFLFSSTYRWGGLVSSARFGGPKGDDSVLRQRTAKQALCALLKSFDVPMSPDRDCVTSYSRDLVEFDAKGNRPDAATLKLFRKSVANINSRWQNRRMRPPLSE
jgi:hypothetical protein